MTHDEFDELLSLRLEKIRESLQVKAAEYASGDDRLHNFHKGAAITGQTPAEVCLGFMVKHWSSVVDIVHASAKGLPVSQERINEKIGDSINYLILLEAVLIEVNHK